MHPKFKQSKHGIQEQSVTYFQSERKSEIRKKYYMYKKDLKFDKTLKSKCEVKIDGWLIKLEVLHFQTLY